MTDRTLRGTSISASNRAVHTASSRIMALDSTGVSGAFGEERIAFGVGVHKLHQVIRDLFIVQMRADQLSRASLVETAHRHVLGDSLAHQIAYGFSKMVFAIDVRLTIGAQYQHARIEQMATQVHQQGRAGGVSPLQVVQEQNDWSGFRSSRQEVRNCAKDLQLGRFRRLARVAPRSCSPCSSRRASSGQRLSAWCSASGAGPGPGSASASVNGKNGTLVCCSKHRPTHACAPVDFARSSTSRASRKLPTPGPPYSRAIRPLPAAAALKLVRMRASSCSRPTSIGLVWRASNFPWRCDAVGPGHMP